MKDKRATSQTDSQILKRVFQDCIRPRSGKIIFAIICMIISAISTAAVAYLIKPAVDETMFSRDNERMLYIIPLIIMLVTIIKSLAQYGHMLTMQNAHVSIQNSLRERMFSHFINSDLSLFSKKSSGGMMSNMTNDVGSIMGLISLIITGAFLNLFTAIALLGNMIYQNYMLTIIAFGVFPIAFYPVYWISRRIKRLVVKNQRMSEKYFSLMDDSLGSIKVVKSYNAEGYELSRMQKMIKNIYRLNKKINKIAVFPSPFMEALAGVGIALVLWYSGEQVSKGTMTPGQFFSFFATLMMAYKPIKALAGFNTKYQTFMSGVKRAYKIMDQKPSVKNSETAKDLINVKGDIEFKDVSFAYDKNENVINGLTFKAKQGGKYAFVGRSGGGKSTIFSLLLRFFENQSGHIKIDGHDIKNLKSEDIRNSISYVGQDTHLFEGSVIDNIRYGKFDATKEEVVKAAKLAQAHDFILTLPWGYDTKLGQRGGKLSGGQRQRVSIARAILKNAPILLLDEATSALDVESEKQVQTALEKLMKGKTTLVIAHKLSTITNADKIFVVNNGKIQESGSHKELLSNKNNLYHNLYNQ